VCLDAIFILCFFIEIFSARDAKLLCLDYFLLV